MDFAFKTIHEFNDYFKDEKTCYTFLELQRWNGKPACPHCGSEKFYTVKSRGKFTDIPSYRCANRTCDLPFTVRTGSIFEGSKVELRKWFQASYELSTAKKGISSVELATRIGVSQKTAWFINHRLRAMLAETAPALLTGIIEADETYVGGKNKNRHADKKVWNTQGRSAADKTPVVGLLERNGRVLTFVVPNTEAKTIQPLMVENVAKNATLITDAYRSYRGLDARYNHVTVKHTEGNYVTDSHFHTNNIEGFWSLLKRGVIGTFHYVSPQHLHRYCTEFSYRYNNRDLTNLTRFSESLKNAGNARITYKQLIENKR